MKRILVCVVGLAILIGCEPKERATIVTEGAKAWDHAAKAAVTAWESVAKKAAEITPAASKQAMDSARAAVESARKKLEEVPNPTPEIQKKIEAARAGISKIDAAATLKELQDKASSMVESAKEQADNAGKTYNEVKSNLEQANAQYKALQERIRQAEEGYQKASEKLDEAARMM
jgi:chromosome segregation ATPase